MQRDPSHIRSSEVSIRFEIFSLVGGINEYVIGSRTRPSCFACTFRL